MSVWANRIIILLSWLGIYIAGVLTYSKAANLLAPCTIGHGGCAQVALSPYASFFGVPVAYMGLGAYVVMMGLAVLRAWAPSLWVKTGLAGLVISGIGMGFSAYLTFMSFDRLHTECSWCIGSFATILALFMAHAALLQGRSIPERVHGIDIGAVVVGFLAAVTMLGTTTQAMMTGAGSSEVLDIPAGVTIKDVLGPQYKWKGNPDAQVSLIEWADYNCPACRATAPVVQQTFDKYKGKLRWVYRNFPLTEQGHETSTRAALFSEMAGEKGKYWDFVEEAFKPENEERVKDNSGAGLIGILNDMGLDGKDFAKRADSGTDTALGPLTEDMSLAARELKFTGTPTLVIVANGVPTRKVSMAEFVAVLNAEPYKGLLGN